MSVDEGWATRTERMISVCQDPARGADNRGQLVLSGRPLAVASTPSERQAGSPERGGPRGDFVDGARCSARAVRAAECRIECKESEFPERPENERKRQSNRESGATDASHSVASLLGGPLRGIRLLARKCRARTTTGERLLTTPSEAGSEQRNRQSHACSLACSSGYDRSRGRCSFPRRFPFIS